MGTREDARECQHFDRSRGIFRWDRYGEGVWRLSGPYGTHGLRRESRRRHGFGETWNFDVTSIISAYSWCYLLVNILLTLH